MLITKIKACKTYVNEEDVEVIHVRVKNNSRLTVYLVLINYAHDFAYVELQVFILTNGYSPFL